MTRARRTRRAGSLLALAIAAAVCAAAVLGFFWVGPGPSAKPVTVAVERGSSLSRVAYALEKAGAIRSAGLFRRLAGRLGTGAPVKYGEYRIPARASAAEVLRLLQSGEALQYRVTIPEGMPAVLVQERLLANPALTGQVAAVAEGSILPDTYSFERDEPRAKVLARMQAAMTRTLAEEWKARSKAAVVRSPEEALILASIVEKETGKPAERRMVAGVYSNRLRIGMKLDADPTVIYPITKGKPLGRRIKRSELRRDTGYNTYLKPGLPKGPIANPGRASIAAVLNPAPTKALYFVADGTGGHVFAATLAEQNANVAKWRAIRHARGEM